MAVGWRANNIYYDYDVDDDDTTSDGISSSSASETSGKWMEVTRSHHLEHYHQPSRYSPHYHHHHHRLLKQAHQADRPADLIKMVLVSAALEKSSKSQELGGDSAMDKMKKILGSPMTKKRSMVASTPSAGQAGKYFGVALEEITTREGSHIPHLVTRVCTYIKEYGITQEGIFRVNGNSRIVDRLKASFDRAGDADLEEAGDVMAVAGMLKLYLRELPEPVIPDYLTSKFIAIQNESGHNVKEVIERLRHLLGKLPTVNYQLLKYLCRFLVLVSLAQNLNKMSPMALGIVFGPNVFRCSGGMEGLRQQGTTNQITLHFILKYDQLFVEDGEISPYINHSLSDGKKGKMSPPRPPPPSLDSPTSQHPVPLPRKSRRKAAENPNGHFTSDSDPSGETTPRTPRLSDEEYLDTNRSVSPFVLDRTVEKTISTSISQHLFGEPSDSLSSDEQPAHQSSEVTPVPAPRQKRDQLDSLEDLNEDDLGKENRPLAAHKTSVKDRIHLFEADDIATSSREHPKPRKQRPRSKAFEIFESQGIIIGMAPGNLHVESHGDAVESPEVEKHFLSNSGNVSPSSPSHPIPPPRGAKRNVNGEETREGERMETSITRDDSELSKVPTSNPLTSFKRPAGPKNRRTPSRHSLRQMVPGDEDGEDEGDGAEEAEEVAEEAREKDVIVSPEQGEEEEEDGIELVEDVNHNATTKPSIRFLDIHHHNHNGNNEPASPDRQHPMIGHVHKPYIPPLDLSILHEHGDGSDPILAEQGLSLAILHKAKSGTRDDEVILSPRTSKLKKKANWVNDTDEAPSPPKSQFLFTLSNMGLSHEDEFANTIKQLTRRIQTYKKKIKTFEENFEDDYGYRPSQSDKANKPEIKKTMQQLAFARKELKRVKERLREYNDQMSDGGELSPRYGSPAHHAALDEDFFQPPTIEDTLDLLMRKLREKQDECQRPAYLEDMSRDQIQDEKLAVQKTLLQYENIHGRPSSESAKKLMKPLYDRYRTIKRILAKPTSPREKKLDLPPVPEDDAVEFSHDAESKSPQHAINIPTSVSPHETDFTVTQNLGLLTTKDTLKPHDDNAQLDTSPEGPQQWKANLHELTVPQLLEEQTRARNDKKRLRRVLREFEEDFFQHTGRKVQKEDRAPMEAEYHEYKQVKARLKLLDALLVKYDPTL